MPQEQYIYNRPTVKVMVTENYTSDHVIKQILYGIEEEGIPSELSSSQGSASSLAWEASQQSRLEVGLGVDEEHVILQHGKMDKTQPLFQISARSPDRDLRAIGANAARLVKKIPFKQL